MGINPVLQTGLLNQSSAQVIDGSLRFDKSKTTHLKRTFPYTGDVKRWTWSCWFQRTHFDSGTNFYRIFGSTETNHFYFYEDDLYFDLEGTSQRLITNQKFRDNEWYHLVVILDTPNTTSSDRMRLYINGERITSFSTANYPAIDPYQGGFLNGRINRDLNHDIGYRVSPAGGALSANISQVYFISGQTLEPEYFGFTDPLTGTWRPKKFGYFNSAISTQYSGASALTWDDNPIGSVYTLSNGNRTATAGGGGSGYSGADVWSNAIPANSTTAWTLDVTNSDNVGGWYFTDSQTESGTHPDERGGNSLGMRNQDADAGWFGTFATANGGSNQGHVLDLPEADTWGSKRVDFVVYRPTSGTGKVWVKDNNVSTWIGGGDPSNTSSTPSFIIPDGDTYFGYTFYDRSNGDQIATLDGDGSIQQKIGPTSFYLPFDGNSPIGQDKSGNGNDFTPVNFGGSNSVDKATGALPILNTTQGGTQATVGVRTDAYASNLVVAMPLVDITDDVSNLVNSGTTAKTVSQTGSSSDIASSTKKSNFYASSAKFYGNVARLEISGGGGTDGDYDFGTGDFTMECWFYPTATVNTNNRLFCSRGDRNNYQLMIGSSKYLQFDIAGTSYTSANNVFGLNKWHHFAATRQSGTLRLFVNGVIVKEQASVTDDLDETTGIDIGYESGYSSYINGYMQDARVYKGVAKYTSNFIPASTDPDILPDTPSGVSGGSKLAKITDGAVAFDGTNDSLSVSDHADFTFGSGDFTMEAFVYNRSSGYRSIVMKYGGSPAASSWFWSMYNGQNQFYYYSGSNEPAVTSSKTHYNKWVHCAVSREGNTIRIFDDGELTGTLDVSSYDTMNDSTVPLDIGADYADNYDMDGFISNVRIVKGTALYTSNFTPPSAPLTNVTNTKLLCCQSNTSATEAAVAPPVTGYTGTGAITLSSASLNAGAVANIVDGNTSTSADIRGAGSFVQMVFPQQQNGTLQVNVANGNDVGDDNIRVFIDGVEGTSFDVSSQQWYTIHTGNFTTVKLEAGGSTTGYIYGFRIGTGGDTIINDGITANGDAAATNFNPFNTSINTVRGQETGYPTMNPLAKNSAITLEDGNLRITQTDSHGQKKIVYSNAKIPNGGKWYVEWIMGGAGACTLGIGKNGKVEFRGTDTQIGTDTNSWGYEPQGNLFHNGNQGGSFGSCAAGDVIGMTIDTSGVTLTIQWHKNGVLIRNSSGTICQFTGISLDEDYVVMMSHHTPQYDTLVNFGQKPFKFPPPDGFQPLNATNILPETAIPRPDQYIGITTWSGDNVDGREIDMGMSPDLIWVKTRNQTNWNWLTDTVRGAPNKLYSNSTNTEDTAPIYGQADSFTDKGWIAGGGTDGSNPLSDSNQTGTNYVCWGWKAGGNKGTFNVDDEGYANASDVNMNVGALNSSAYDQSRTWSTACTVTLETGVSVSNGTIADIFDNSASTYYYTSSSNTGSGITHRITFPSGVRGSKVRIYNYYDSGSAQALNSANVNDLVSNTNSNPGGWVTIYDGVETDINYISFGSYSGAVDNVTQYIEIDGKVLVDNGVSVPNVPSIAPTGASVGTRQGFSIISYTGDSQGGDGLIPHGLSQEPDFMIFKSRTTGDNWAIYHSSLGKNYLEFTNQATGGNPQNRWSSLPTDKVIYLGSDTNINTINHIMYVWHDVPGLQKFGTFTANSSTDGSYVELGFRPSIVWVKAASNAGDMSYASWLIADGERSPTNPVNKALFANKSVTETKRGNGSDNFTDNWLDILSNGFKIRYNGTEVNGVSGQTYIYCAWAEAPTVNLFGGQSNAR